MLVIEKNMSSTSKPCHARRFNGDLRRFARWAGTIQRSLKSSILNGSIKVPRDNFLVISINEHETVFNILSPIIFHQQFQLVKVRFEREAYFLKRGTPIILPNGVSQAKHEKLKYDLIVDNWVSLPKILKVLITPIMGDEWCRDNDIDFFITKHFVKASSYDGKSNLIQLEYPDTLSWHVLDLNDFNMDFIEARQKV